ncbi:MAG: MnhB domain-containing protein [Hyphomonadaceae bacterium]
MLRGAAKAAVPMALLFAAYLAASGAAGPGGGFAGGGFAAASLIFYGLVFGAEAARRAVAPAALRIAAVTGVLAFVGLGAASLTRGYAFLDYHALAAASPGTQRLGGFLTQGAAFLVTAASLTLAYHALAARAAAIADEDG